MSTSKPVFAVGETIVVNYSDFSGDVKDWIDIVTASTPDGQGQGLWKYTNGVKSGTMTFGGMQSGEYEVRCYFRNESIIRVRYRFRVGNSSGDNAIVKTEKEVYAPNEKVTVNFSGFPGNAKDWIGIAPSSYKDDQLQYWYYTEGKLSGNMDFPGLPEGQYEVRAFYNNEYTVRARYTFFVGKKVVTASGDSMCRSPLSVFYAGMTGLGAAWSRTTLEPTTMTSAGVAAMQSVLGNARDAMMVWQNCIAFDINKFNALMSRLPLLTNVQAEAEIRAMILEIQGIISASTSPCARTINSLFVTGVHVGAAQVHAFSRVCQPTPMSMDYQIVIRNHLNTARDAFAAFLPCVPGFSLNQFDNIPLNSMNSTEAFTNIVGLHTNILWNIALSNCCCNCR